MPLLETSRRLLVVHPKLESRLGGGVQSLSAALVAFGALYLRWRYSINPNAVYRQAMMRLNTHPGLLEARPLPPCPV